MNNADVENMAQDQVKFYWSDVNNELLESGPESDLHWPLTKKV